MRRRELLKGLSEHRAALAAERTKLDEALVLLGRARPYVKGPHYVDEYGTELEEEYDKSPVLLEDIDALMPPEVK